MIVEIKNQDGTIDRFDIPENLKERFDELTEPLSSIPISPLAWSRSMVRLFVEFDQYYIEPGVKH